MIKTFQHQNEAIDFILRGNRNMGSLLWHEMGLGKTLAAILAIRALLAQQRAAGVAAPKALIIVPKTLVAQWRSEIHKFAPDLNQSIVFVPYSQLHRAKHLVSYYDIRVIVLDESHAIKTPETERVAMLCSLLTAIEFSPGAFKNGKIICLSGTPMDNQAAELFTTWAMCTSTNLIQAASRMQDQEKYEKWKANFTKQELKSWKTRYDTKYGKAAAKGVANEDKLMMLIGPITHYRRAKDCLDLPDLQEIPIDLGLEDDRLLKDADIERPDAYMALLERLARAKTPYAIEWVRSFLADSSEQLVVFSPYLFALEELHSAIKGSVMLVGECDDGERSQAEMDFKAGKARVILMTYKAGGVGLNFQCARTSLYLGYPWTPGVIRQAIGRTHRNGQKFRTLHYFLTSGENDRKILGIIRGKEKAVTSVEDNLLSFEQSNIVTNSPIGVENFI